MKKTLFAALALAFVASCSNEEVVEMAQKEAISFENAFVNNSTRSVSDPSLTLDGTNKLANFQVYGFVADSHLFGADGTEVSKNGNAWTYTETQYWIKDAKYNFAAVAPVTNGGWVVKDNTEPSKNSVTLTVTNTDGTNDVLYAHSGEITGQAPNQNSPVAFTFNHIMSKVKFSFLNSYNASNTVIRVRNIKITNAYKTCDVTLASTDKTTDQTVSSTIATWATLSGDKNVTLDFGNASTIAANNTESDIAIGAEMESYNERLLIPGQAIYNVTFIVDIVVDGDVIATYDKHTATVNHNFVAGYAYDIKATINEKNIDPANEQQAIQFTVTAINDWNYDHEGYDPGVDATVNTTPATGENGSNTGGIGGN